MNRIKRETTSFEACAAVISILFVCVALTTLHAEPPSARASQRETPVVKVVQQWAPAVVNIATERIVLLRQHPFWGNYGMAFDSFFDDYFGQNFVSALKLKSVGSGIIIREDGLILTNAHVVNMANKIYVVYSDGTTTEGSVVGISQKNDIALIKIAGTARLKAVRLARPDDILIGETVVAIGNPLGLENTVSVGVISGKNRTFVLPNGGPAFSDLLQTDAPINPGNSGGALFNLDGQLVGINLAVVQNAQGIGFAIPAKEIYALLTDYDRQSKSKDASDRPIKIPVKYSAS